MQLIEKIRQADLELGYGWVVVGLWFLGTTSGFMSMFSLGILLPSISSDFDLSPGKQGLLGSSAFWGSIVFSIPMSWFASRFRPKLVLTLAFSLATLLLLAHGWSPAFIYLLVARLGFGINVLVVEPPGVLLIQQWFSQRMIVLVNSLSAAMFGLVTAVGLVITPVILEALDDDWRSTFYLFAAFFAVITVAWMVLGRERVSEEYRSREAPREEGVLRGALAYRDLWVAAFGFLGGAFVWSAFVSFLPTHLLEAYDISLRWSGLILALSSVAGGISGLVVGFVVMAKDLRKVIIQVFGILMTLSYLAMTQTGSLPLLFVLSFLAGVAGGFWPLLYTVPFLLPGIRPREVAVGVAFTLVLVSIGTLLGPLLTGYLNEAYGNWSTPLLIASFGGLTASASGFLLRLRGTTPTPAQATH